MLGPIYDRETYENRRDAVLYLLDYVSEKKWFRWVTNKLSIIF